MKRIVICSDGTWNAMREHGCNTNVVKLHDLVSRQDSKHIMQVCFYDAGVGTAGDLDGLVGGITGCGLETNIKDCYRFLVETYAPGDEVYLFGFSRGAYTVRSLVGLIYNSGLLHQDRIDLIPSAFKRYRSRELKPRSAEMKRFRKENALEIPIRFLGVWDTVGALGIPVRRFNFLKARHQFHDTKLSRIVEFAAQALAIDERRTPFRPAIWSAKATSAGHPVEQVWFAGDHRNIGGGLQKSESVSDIALAWMMEKAEVAGLAFDRGDRMLQQLNSDPLAELHIEISGLFRLIGLADREVMAFGQGLQSIHPSVEFRCRHDSGYRPDNIRDHLPEDIPSLW